MAKKARPLLIIISGPSGVGKDAVLTAMKKAEKPYFFAVTATTRPQRSGEIDGVDYHFVKKEEFMRMIENKELLEWANVYGNLYGVPKQPIENALREGRDAIVKVDIQGAATIKRNKPKAVSVFIAPPSMEELQRRLMDRKTESWTSLDLRLKTARKEMGKRSSFDYVVISPNDKIDQVISEIETIIQIEKSHALLRFFYPHPKKGSLAWQIEGFEWLKPMRLGDTVLRIRRRSSLETRIRRYIRRFLARLRRRK